MGDLGEFMDEVETRSLVTIPEQFDEVVDLVVEENRERAELLVNDQINNQGKHAQEILDESGKPMWMKFLKEDYLGENLSFMASTKSGKAVRDQGEEMAKKLSELTDKEQKL